MIPQFSSPFSANRQALLCNWRNYWGKGEEFTGEGEKQCLDQGYQTQLRNTMLKMRAMCSKHLHTECWDLQLSSITGLQEYGSKDPGEYFSGGTDLFNKTKDTDIRASR